MSWEHTLAKELKCRDNPHTSAWAEGRVLSPTRASDGKLVGDLVIQAFGLMLRSDRLVVPSGVTLESGMTVPLIGNPFSGESGSQKILVVASPPAEIDETLLDWEVE